MKSRRNIRVDETWNGLGLLRAEAMGHLLINSHWDLLILFTGTLATSSFITSWHRRGKGEYETVSSMYGLHTSSDRLLGRREHSLVYLLGDPCHSNMSDANESFRPQATVTVVGR